MRENATQQLLEANVRFLKDIEESRYFKIRLLNLKTQARHKIAVLVKSILKSIRK